MGFPLAFTQCHGMTDDKNLRVHILNFNIEAKGLNRSVPIRVGNVVLRSLNILDRHARTLLHFSAGLAEPFGDGFGQFSSGIEHLGHGILTVFAGLIGPLTVIFGVRIVVLDPVVQQFDKLFRKRERSVDMVVIVVVVVIMVMVMMIVSVIVIVVVGHWHSPVRLG